MKKSSETTLSARLTFCALLALGCASNSDRTTGGETHFLTLCDESTEAEVCGDLQCVCNICTLPCGEEACGAFQSAVCVDSNATCADAPVTNHCDVLCTIDADCAALSPSYRCEAGACRADATDENPSPLEPSDASADAGTTTGADSSAASDAGTCPAGEVPASEVSADEVLIIGDSFFGSENRIAAALEELARSAGSLATSESYRDESSIIGNALAFTGPGIANQYAAGVEQSPVSVVIMNGGGADALVGDCESADAECPLLVAAAAAAEELLVEMADDGVAQVVYVFYPNPLDAETRERLDALRPLIQALCESSPAPCHWLDLRPTFADRYDELILPDGLNPTLPGAQATAQEIWAILQQQCVAQ